MAVAAALTEKAYITIKNSINACQAWWAGPIQADLWRRRRRRQAALLTFPGDYLFWLRSGGGTNILLTMPGWRR